MRVQQFLEAMSGYNFQTAEFLASQPKVNGGWEVWFQVEMAMYLIDALGEDDIVFSREEYYPGSVDRCDFYVEYNSGRDQTYIELKCQNPFARNPVNDVFTRLMSDIRKQGNHSNVPGFCLAAVYCTIDEVYRLLQRLTFSSFYALDCQAHQVYNTNDIRYLSGQGAGPQLFVLGVSP